MTVRTVNYTEKKKRQKDIFNEIVQRGATQLAELMLAKYISSKLSVKVFSFFMSQLDFYLEQVGSG